jgi:uncharacterized protein (DUF4415 family)
MKHINDDYEMKEERDFTGGIRGRFYTPKKVSITIRLDDDVLLYLKKVGYQTLLNNILHEYMQKDYI